MYTKESFTEVNLLNPQPLAVEMVASDSHETREISDPWNYLVKNGKLISLTGELIEEVTAKENDPYLASVEGEAVKKIQNWAKDNNGIALWFSPPYSSKYRTYPKFKIVIHETLNVLGQKALFNRAIAFYCDIKTMFNLANELEQRKFDDLDELRKNPIFITSSKYLSWFEKLLSITKQAKKIKTNEDLNEKMKTYSLLGSINYALLITEGYKYDNYYYIHQIADQAGLIGEAQGSCGGTTEKTTSEENSKETEEIKILECVCPFCGKRVHAVIVNGSIHCPACGKSVHYSC